MICTLTARRIKPGQYEAAAAAFQSAVDEAPEEVIRRWPNAYVCRDVTDESVMLSFGFFDGTLEELREIQDGEGGGPQEALAEYVDEVLLDGSYEVVEKIKN